MFQPIGEVEGEIYPYEIFSIPSLGIDYLLQQELVYGLGVGPLHCDHTLDLHHVLEEVDNKQLSLEFHLTHKDHVLEVHT